MLPGQVIKFTVRARASGQLAVNTFHYSKDTTHPIPPGGNPALQFLEKFKTDYRAAVVPIFGSQYVVEEYRAQVWTNLALDVGPPARYTPVLTEVAVSTGNAAADTGPRVGDQSCLFEAIGVRKHTGLPGKRWRGANRLGPLLEVDVVNSLVAGAVLALLPAVSAFLLNPIVDPVSGFGVAPCVYSLAQHAANGIATDAELATRGLTSITYRPFVSSQVTRKLGRGSQ